MAAPHRHKPGTGTSSCLLCCVLLVVGLLCPVQEPEKPSKPPPPPSLPKPSPLARKAPARDRPLEPRRTPGLPTLSCNFTRVILLAAAIARLDLVAFLELVARAGATVLLQGALHYCPDGCPTAQAMRGSPTFHYTRAHGGPSLRIGVSSAYCGAVSAPAARETLRRGSHKNATNVACALWILRSSVRNIALQ